MAGFYDNEVKEVCIQCPRLLIIAINSIFNKQHNINQDIIFLDKELNINSGDNPTFMDLFLQLDDDKYHLEFQLLEGKMALRMYEYGINETIRELETESEDLDSYEISITMPHQTVIFLSSVNKRNVIRINLTLPDEQCVSYTLPCISASESIDTLCQKELYIFLPFQQVQLNERMNNIGKVKDINKMKSIARELFNYRKSILNRLENLKDNGILTINEYNILFMKTLDVDKYLTEKDNRVNLEVISLGDENYVPWSERMKLEGKTEGKTITLINQICKKIQKNIPIEIIADELEVELSVVKPIYEEALKFAPNFDDEKIFISIQNSKLNE